MRNLKTKRLLLFMFALFAIIFVGLSYLGDSTVNDIWSALKTAYKTIPILLTIWSCFVWFGWKLCVFQRWLVPFPNLNGTWEGTIQTTWKDPKTGATPGPIPVILTIKQSFTTVSCVMRTGEMTSRSYLADFWIDPDNQIRKLGYLYTSSPSVLIHTRSRPHDGTIVFDIIGDSEIKLSGKYWTERNTTGVVVLTFKNKSHMEEYPDDLGPHPMQKGT